MSKKVIGIFDRTLDLCSVSGGVLFIAIMLAVSVKVVFRYFLHIALVGTDEISEVTLLYITFLGTAWLLRKEGHVRIDILFIRLKPKTQARLNIITSVLGAIMCLVLVWYGTLATLGLWHRGIVTPTILELPRALTIAIIPVGSLLLSLQFMRRAWSYVTGKEQEERKTVGARGE